MQVGTVKEIKAHEYRVGLTPSCVRAYTARGHEVIVESQAGANAGFSDAEYTAAGAVALSSTIALTSATLRFGLAIANHGLEKACRLSPEIAKGVNLYAGNCVYYNVAKDLELDYKNLDECIG